MLYLHMLPLLDNNIFTGLHTKPTNAFLEALSTFLNLATGSDTLEIKQKAAFFLSLPNEPNEIGGKQKLPRQQVCSSSAP